MSQGGERGIGVNRSGTARPSGHVHSQGEDDGQANDYVPAGKDVEKLDLHTQPLWRMSGGPQTAKRGVTT